MERHNGLTDRFDELIREIRKREDPKPDNWMRSLLAGLLITVVGAAIGSFVGVAQPLLRNVGGLEKAVDTLSKDLSKVSAGLEELAKQDVRDLRERMLLLEQKQILPEADQRLQEVEESLQRLQLKINQKDTGT